MSSYNSRKNYLYQILHIKLDRLMNASETDRLLSRCTEKCVAACGAQS